MNQKTNAMSSSPHKIEKQTETVKNLAPRRVFDAVVGGHRRVGRPRTRWKDQVEEALTSIGVTNWSRRAQSTDVWREALRQVETR